MNTVLNISTAEIIHWFNAVRGLKDSQRDRMLDAFWAGQIDSKGWLVNTLNEYVNNKSNIYIFGGWVGVLANLLFQGAKFEIGKIRSIDIDPWCEGVADTVNKIHEMDGWRFKALTSDMAEYKYSSDIFPNIVINTSSEHVSQETYDTWYGHIPNGSLVVVQGNNFFNCPEHVRCSVDIDQFMVQNQVVDPVYTGSLDTQLYTRYMCIWYKK